MIRSEQEGVGGSEEDSEGRTHARRGWSRKKGLEEGLGDNGKGGLGGSVSRTIIAR